MLTAHVTNVNIIALIRNQVKHIEEVWNALKKMKQLWIVPV